MFPSFLILKRQDLKLTTRSNAAQLMMNKVVQNHTNYLNKASQTKYTKNNPTKQGVCSVIQVLVQDKQNLPY